MKKVLIAAVLSAGALAFIGCASRHEEGVTSTYRSQSLDVSADTSETTDAAREVLEEAGLKNVTANATKVDGQATGRQADGTQVKVAVKRQEGGSGSTVWVTVGTIGDPALGADMAKRIKERAEDGATTRPTT